MNEHTSPVFSIIIPVFNKWELTGACLKSLAKHTREYPFEVIVVDNASTDETPAALPQTGQALFGDAFTYLGQQENVNFGPACNIGAEAAKAPLLFFLNNDTLATRGWAPPLVEAFKENDRLGAVGPLLLYQDNTVQHLGVVLTSGGFSHLYRRFPYYHPVVGKKRKLQAITAAAIMLPAAFFQECGGFYPGYANGFEDLELCAQIRRRGKEVACVTHSVIYHLESQTQGRKDKDDRNAAILRERCSADFYLDLHHHGLRDGFDVFVDDLMDISLRLKDDEENALLAGAEDKSPEEIFQLIKDNPFWVGGREKLADFFEARGALEEALFLRIELTNFLMTIKSFKALMRSAAKAGNQPVLAQAEENLQKAMRFTTDIEHARRTARSRLSYAQTKNDRILEKLYQEKLASFHA